MKKMAGEGEGRAVPDKQCNSTCVVVGTLRGLVPSFGRGTAGGVRRVCAFRPAAARTRTLGRPVRSRRAGGYPPARPPASHGGQPAGRPPRAPFDDMRRSAAPSSRPAGICVPRYAPQPQPAPAKADDVVEADEPLPEAAPAQAVAPHVAVPTPPPPPKRACFMAPGRAGGAGFRAPLVPLNRAAAPPPSGPTAASGSSSSPGVGGANQPQYYAVLYTKRNPNKVRGCDGGYGRG